MSFRVVYARGTRENVLSLNFEVWQWPILCYCLCATATRSRPHHWLYLQIPPWCCKRCGHWGICNDRTGLIPIWCSSVKYVFIPGSVP